MKRIRPLIVERRTASFHERSPLALQKRGREGLIYEGV